MREPLLAILWFDTEDYVLPESDDAALAIAEMCTELGITATFKMVGEKVRHLQRAGRTDVLEALGRHEIGYHTDLHSRPPTPAVYLQHASWEEGITEFLRRERAGFETVQECFGRTPVTYGQPGSSWVPQAFPALRELWVPSYLDESNHLSLGQAPYFYGGLLNINGLRDNVTRMELDGDRLQDAKDHFQAIAERLRAEGGGLISVPYHPCEFVQTEFWDAPNYNAGGTVPADELMRLPIRPAEETGFQLARFREYLEFLLEHVRFVTVAELMEIYHDELCVRPFAREEVAAIAGGLTPDIDALEWGGGWLSPADQFWLLVQAAAHPERDEFRLTHLDGPSRRRQPSAGMADPDEVPGWLLREAVTDLADALEVHCQVPSEVWLGSVSVSPESFLLTLAHALAQGWPETVAIRHGELRSADAVGTDPDEVWSWPIFPAGFASEQIMELARLQTWTLKPAVRAAI